MARSILVVLAVLQSIPVAAQPQGREVAIVVGQADAAKRPIIDKISASLQGQGTVAVYVLDPINIADPIEKGKLVASLQARSLVVAVGDEATGFVFRELEDTRVYFVGAGLVSGEWLKSKFSAGIFSYNIDAFLGAVKDLWPGAIGLVYTPGYEPVAAWIRQGASARGIVLREKKIDSIKEFTPAIRELLDGSRTIWVLGDPLLVRGAGFEFLSERALSRKIPVIAPGLWEIQHGAFLGFDPAADALASRASEAIGSVLSGTSGGAPRFEPAPGDGTLLINETLADRWKVAPPSGQRWRLVR